MAAVDRLVDHVTLMRQGEIWVARLNPNQSAEVGKLRPLVIVEADPITQEPTGQLHCRRTASRSAVATASATDPSAALSPEELAELERALLGVLGIGLV